jgi:drug/metabolite transporter (DMT)-like permease
MFSKISPGVKHILIAGLFFSLINAGVKYLSAIPAIEIVFFRSIVTLILSFIMIKKLKLKIINEHFQTLFLRGLTGAIALSLYFYTIQNMPLATAVTLLYLAPVFTVILAIPMVGEYPNKKQWPFLLLGLIGAALMKGTDVRVSFFHFTMGLTAALFAGLAYNFIRQLKGKAHHQLIIFFFPLVTLPICIPMMIPGWVTPSPSEFVGLITIGIFTQIAQVHMTQAYLLEKASKISHFNYLTAAYALVMGIFFFNETIDFLSICGLVVIVISVYLTSRYSDK